MLMTTPLIVHRETIVDSGRLDAALAGAVRGAAEHIRRRIVLVLREGLAAGRLEIERRFNERPRGAATVASQSYLMDTLVRSLFRVSLDAIFPTPNPTSGEQLAILATGGYGRGELAPYSDIDLLFLLPYKTTPRTEQIIEFMLYALWDLGLKVGHATRSLDDALRQAQNDITIRTSLLEARLLCGSTALAQTLLKRFRDEIVAGSAIAFVDAKLAERRQRHARMGDSRYVLEPNIKEGKGGLRDLHSLFWIAKYLLGVESLAQLVERGVLLPEEARRFARAQEFLWTLRCHLHYLTGRPEECLTFDVQTEIGRRMGYRDHAGTRGVERFMKHYFLTAKDVGDLTRIFIAALEAEEKAPVSTPNARAVGLGAAGAKTLLRRIMPLSHRWNAAAPAAVALAEGFRIEDRRLSAAEDIFERDPVNLVRLFHIAQAERLEVHPHLLRAVTRARLRIDAKLRADPEANRLFVEILTSPNDPESALRRMNEAGVLGRFIPEFGRIVSQMQYDMYHVYTVDEHSIVAIGNLARIESGHFEAELPLRSALLGSAIVDSVNSRRALYLAVFLHDIAKGRGGDHSELGAEIALKLAPRLGLSAEETETVAWLVRYHLLMSRTAFKRDIDDPKTVADFVEIVQSPERLKLLTILTAADIRAVGPGVWNGWKGGLLRQLYEHALDILAGGVVAESNARRVAKQRHEVRSMLPDFGAAEIARIEAAAYPYFWLSADPATLARQIRLMREADASGAPLTVTNRVDAARSVTEITVYTGDHAGLFSRITGAIAVSGARIVDARIVTMATGMALDTFWVQDPAGGAFDQPDRLARLAFLFENVLAGRVNPAIELKRGRAYPARTEVFTVPPRVLIDNNASGSHTVIEINGRDRPALLFDLTRAITRLGLSIASAKISTYGEKVVDVFYVKDVFGLKIDSERRLAEIRHRLNQVLRDEGQRAPASPNLAEVAARV